MNVLSLFSGIGGLDLGLERAGMTIVAHSEIDPYACKVLKKHWPDVPNLGDITQIDFGRFDDAPDYGWWRSRDPELRDSRGEVSLNVDVIAGGFPCQDISLAGKGAGIEEGTRSGLWSEYARAVRSLRPRYVVVENVAALLARGIDRVLGDLASLGYDAWWDCVPAASIGAPHLRDRIFIVATRGDVASFDTDTSPMQWSTQQRNESNRDTEGIASHADDAGRQKQRGGVTDGTQQPPSECASETATHPNSDGLKEFSEHVSESSARRRVQLGRDAHGLRGPSPASQWEVEPDVGRVVDGLPSRVDRLRGLGNAVVPQVAEYIGQLVMAHAEIHLLQETHNA